MVTSRSCRSGSREDRRSDGVSLPQIVQGRSGRAVRHCARRLLVPGPPRHAVVKTGSSYLSQSELPLSFGLGRETTVDRVEIEWPSGGREVLKALAAGVSYEVVEGKGVPAKTLLITVNR